MLNYLFHCPQPPSTVIFFILSIETHCERIHHMSLPHTVPSAQGMCWVLNLDTINMKDKVDYHGILDYLNSGLLDIKTTWLLNFWSTELLDYWTTGLLDYRTSRLKTFRLQNTRFRTTELLHHPTSEILEKLNYWATKLQNCWNTIPLDYCVLRLGIGWQDFWTTGLLTY